MRISDASGISFDYLIPFAQNEKRRRTTAERLISAAAVLLSPPPQTQTTSSSSIYGQPSSFFEFFSFHLHFPYLFPALFNFLYV